MFAIRTLTVLVLTLSTPVAGSAAPAIVDEDESETEAKEREEDTEPQRIVVEDEIDVTATGKEPRLDAATGTGSALGLTVRETPATIDVLTQETMQDLGARTTVEVLNRAPGVVSNDNATSPGLLSMRGFTGSGRAVLLLHDGVRPAEEAFAARILDSWLFESIEILKGPASVTYGEGALAGVVNLVPKQPRQEAREIAGQMQLGSFDGVRVAADANIPLSDTAAARGVVAYSRSSGYVDDTDSEFLAASVGTRWAASDRLTFDLALDYYRDDYDTAYYGTPLVPREFARDPSDLVRSADGRVLDEDLRDVNYNVEDGIVDSDTLWVRSGIEYRLSDTWTLANDLRFYSSDRRYLNAEFFGFNPESGLVDRSTGIVTHDFRYGIDRVTVRGDVPIAGRRNRVAFGGEYSDVDFFTRRRFGSTTSVDPRHPDRGRFPRGDDPTIFPSRQNRDNGVTTTAIFAEDALDLTSRWSLIGGLRFDHIEVDRVSIDLNTEPMTPTPTRRDFDEVTWRLGTVYNLLPRTQLFAQYSTAASPPSALLALSQESARFDMTTGRSVEGGVKSSLLADRIDLTFSGFLIEQDDIVTRSPIDPTLNVQGGRQSSRGGELSVLAAATSRLRIDANLTVFDARFDQLIDARGNDLEGNTPQRVPEQIFNLFLHYDLEALPATMSLGAHHAGRYYTDDANTIEVDGYTTLEAAVRYRLAVGDRALDLTLRGRNLTDELYAGYTDISPDQLTIAPPRSVDFTVATRF